MSPDSPMQEIPDDVRPLALITGGSGAIGSKLVPKLVQKGWRVRVLSLPNDPLNRRLEGIDCTVCPGDVTQPATLTAPVQGVHTLLHLAAVVVSHDTSIFERVNVAGTRHTIEAAERAGVQHFVHVSSASVTYQRLTPYARSKVAAETIVRQSQVPYTIVRPTLAYDADGGLEFNMYLEYLRRFPLVPFIGRGRARKRPVWTEDLVRGLAAIVGNSVAIGRCYNLSGGESVEMRELARLMLQAYGYRNKFFLPVPAVLCRGLARCLELLMDKPPVSVSAIDGVTQDADLDPEEACRDLGYDPLGVREGLSRCFRS